MPANDQPQRCALCERLVSRTTRHHLIPRSEGGHEIVELCPPCHHTLHRFYSNHTLLKDLHTLEALRQQPEIADYLDWVRKQPDRHIRVHTRRDRR
ncbi:MAG: HNH endonuclease [Anaerolineae bacterium]|nr:HNH endonuclease [Anaerolineae bacterium]